MGTCDKDNYKMKNEKQNVNDEYKLNLHDTAHIRDIKSQKKQEAKEIEHFVYIYGGTIANNES